MGTSAMAQIGHLPRPGERTSGCIGHQNASGRSVSRTISTTRRSEGGRTRPLVVGRKRRRRRARRSPRRIVGSEGHVVEDGVRNRRARRRCRASDGGATRTPLRRQPPDRLGYASAGLAPARSTYCRGPGAIEQHVLTVRRARRRPPCRIVARPLECIRGVAERVAGIRHAVVEVMEANASAATGVCACAGQRQPSIAASSTRRPRERSWPCLRGSCRRLDIQLAACVQSHHRLGHLGIEMRARSLGDELDDLVQGLRGVVGARRRQRVEKVRDAEQPSEERNAIAAETLPDSRNRPTSRGDIARPAAPPTRAGS